jgi:hypothetical protein
MRTVWTHTGGMRSAGYGGSNDASLSTYDQKNMWITPLYLTHASHIIHTWPVNKTPDQIQNMGTQQMPRKSATVTTTTTTTDNTPVDRVTVPVLMSEPMKNAVDAHATKLNMTTSAYIRNLIGADIAWDMSNESRKPRATKYATDAERKMAAKIAADARRKLQSELLAKYRAEQKMAAIKSMENSPATGK